MWILVFYVLSVNSGQPYALKFSDQITCEKLGQAIVRRYPDESNFVCYEVPENEK